MGVFIMKAAMESTKGLHLPVDSMGPGYGLPDNGSKRPFEAAKTVGSVDGIKLL
jgi:hypothetical protein